MDCIFTIKDLNYPRDCQEVNDQCFNAYRDNVYDNSSQSRPSGIYLIKPDGYPEAFEVYCNNSIDNGGWTVCFAVQIRWFS